MNIQEQIEALVQELRPHIGRYFFFNPFNGLIEESSTQWTSISLNVFASTDKAEVEDYADCYRRLKLYQLLGKKAEKEFPIDWTNTTQEKLGTDFGTNKSAQVGTRSGHFCCLGGVWFVREEDRLEALKICGIDETFQEKCAKFGLGGA